MWIKGDTYEIFILDENKDVIGPLDTFESLSMVFKFNDVGNWELTGSYSDFTQITWGSYLKFYRNGTLIMTGKPNKFDRKFTATEDSLTITGFDTMKILKDRITLPDPTEDVVLDETYTYSTAFDTRTGPQETVMKEYIDYNVGSSALSIRQEDGFTIETDEGRGETITWYARFDNLLELLQELAIPVTLGADELGFRMNGFEFEVYEPEDRTNSVIFSVSLGTILTYTYGTEAPEKNYIHAGGSGDDAERIFYTYGDTDSMTRYGMIEDFIDATQVETATDLYPTIIQELFSGSDKTSIQLEPAALDHMKVYDNYWVGDLVTCILDGVTVEDRIRILEINITNDGAVEVKPTIGKNEAYYYTLSKMFDKIRSISSKTDYLGRIR